MPTLSFIRPKAPRWISIVPNRSPFPPGRDDNTSSLHPYASADVIDIHDTTSSFQSTVAETPPTPPPPRLPPAQPFPHIRIELDLPSEPFDPDWFQTRFTSTPSPPNGQRAEGSRSVVGSESRPLVPTTRSDPPQSVPTEVPTTDEEDEDFDLSTSEDDVLGRLRAMDASTFVNLPPHLDLPIQPVQEPEQPIPTPARRNPPTPIRIPSLASHGSHIQIVRSAEMNQSRPLSEISTAESSAVSGQTLARALLGNSFVLSTDTRSSRYRSGFGGLVRSDSATLPRGDHPLMNSPHWRDRTLSGTSDTFAADANVPPIPPNADKVYVPPQTHRHHSAEAKKKTNVRRHSSTGSLSSPTSKGDSNYSRSRPNSVIDLAQEVDIQALRRISRISEAPSTTSTPPANLDILAQPPSPPQSPLETSSLEFDPARLPTSPAVTSPAPTVPSTDDVSPTSSPVLPAPSPVKELENVLEYYSEKPERPFTPTISPIIEESSSQLSSPASKRLSVLGTPKSRTASPLSGTTAGRIDLSTVRRPSDGAVVGRSSSLRRRSVLPAQVDAGSSSPPAPQPSQNANGYASGANQRSSMSPPRPIGAVVGGRLRSGSAPSPIKITRDSRELNAYKIVSPLPESALETPSTGDSNDVMATQQTFPETPNAFSPLLSGGSATSPGMNPKLPEGYEGSSIPYTPRSAAFPGSSRGGHPSLTQQVLLTRATSMVTHGKQASGSFGTVMAQTKPEPAETPTKGDQVVQVSLPILSEGSPLTSASLYSEPSDDQHTPYDEANGGAPATSSSTLESPPMLDFTTRDDSSAYSSSVSATTLPLAPASQYYSTGSSREFGDFDSQPASASSLYNQRTRGVSPHARSIPTPPVVITPPVGESTSSQSPYFGHSLRRISEISHTYESPPPYDTIDHDRPPPISLTPSMESGNEAGYVASNARPSPPITQDSSNEHLPLSRKTSVGNRDRDRDRDRRVRVRPTGPRRPLSHINNQLVSGPTPPLHRARMPSDASVISFTPSTSIPTPQTSSTGTPVVRQTTPTINTPPLDVQPVVSTPPSSSSATGSHNHTTITSPRSPDFKVPDVPYRGMTMDQAKWTFTSSQLQAIVSRAIKQSAEASSIRLLRLDVLDKEIPPELARLENRRTEIKTKYRALTRASESLYFRLSNQIASGSSNAQRTLQELRDVTNQLNKLTEELHSVDQLHAQIRHLVQVHSTSALSMALRKLNGSFMKQVTETQELRKQIVDMADEIWTLNELRSTKENQLLQAQLQLGVALQTSPTQESSTDHSPSERQSHTAPGTSSSQGGISSHTASPTNMTHGSPELERKRSIQMTRKPSLRYSRSMRSSGNRLSQRSSVSSNGPRSSGISGTNSTFSIPPVPPLPRRRPRDIVTDAPTRSATLTTTPNTEVRALMRVQDELYKMLGITLRGESNSLRRSHSLTGVPGTPGLQPHPSAASTAGSNSRAGGIPRISIIDTLESNHPSSSARASRLNSRPLSYPTSGSESYNPMEADRKAMLATLEMISHDDH